MSESDQVSKLLSAIRKIENRFAPEAGTPFKSDSLDEYAEEGEEEAEIRDFASQFLFSHKNEKGEVIYIKKEGNYCIVCSGEKTSTVGLTMYRLLDGEDYEPIHHEEYKCHIECMIIRFFEKTYLVYKNMQSIARSSGKPNPNSPWYDA